MGGVCPQQVPATGQDTEVAFVLGKQNLVTRHRERHTAGALAKSQRACRPAELCQGAKAHVPTGPGGSGCLLTQHPCSRRVSGLWPLGSLPPALFTPCPFLSRVLHCSPAFSSPASSHPLIRSYLLSSHSVIRQCRRCHSHGREQDRAHALLGCPFKPERETERETANRCTFNRHTLVTS